MTEPLFRLFGGRGRLEGVGARCPGASFLSMGMRHSLSQHPEFFRQVQRQPRARLTSRVHLIVVYPVARE